MSPKKVTRNSRSYSCLLRYQKLLLTLGWALTLILPTWADNAIATQAALLPDSLRSSLITAPQGVGTALQPPMQFEPNLGQTDPQVQFMARGVGYTVFLTPTEAVLVLPAGESQLNVNSKGVATPARAKQIIQLQVLNANPSAGIHGVKETPTTIHRLIGADPTQWKTHVPVYAQVRYDAIYPGIDLLYYGNQQQLEYDFIVHPGADPSTISLGIQGADYATLEEDGHLLLSLPGGTLRLQKPVLSQTVDGKTTNIPGHFLLREPAPTEAASPIQVAFAVGAYDPTLPLIIDPLVNYASAFGGEGNDIGEAITVDNAGHGYVVGTTESFTFPVTPQAFQDSAVSPNRDVFVTKFDTETSEILFSTYIGGEGNDRATDVAVDAQGIPYVTGETSSLMFPTQNPLQATLHGPSDAFVLKLAADGSSLLYSTYLGGSGPDHANGLIVDAQGQAALTGTTTSTDFPMMNAFDASLGHGEAVLQSDVFVSTLDTQGTALKFSTFLGGSGADVGHSLTLDAQGALYLTGETTDGAGFPVTPGAFQPTYGGGATDAFIAKINPFLAGATALQYASYLGGSGQDVGLALLVDAQQQAFITGWTTGQGQALTVAAPSPAPAANAPVRSWGRRSGPPTAGNPARGFRGGMRDFNQQQSAPTPPPAPVIQVTTPTPLPAFPVTPNAYDATFNGEKDAFLAHVNTAGSGPAALVYATYVGGNRSDTGIAIGLDSFDRLCIAGTTNSSDYPVNSPLANQGKLSGGMDGFVTKFATDPTALVFSSFLGGSGNEQVTDMRLDALDLAYLTGQTRSTDFPLLTSLDDTPLTGEAQAFVVKVKDPADIITTIVPIGAMPQVGVDKTWRLDWENADIDPALGVQVVFAFDVNPFGLSSKVQFQSIQNGSGPSSILTTSCSGSALSGPGGNLTCNVTDVPSGGILSSADITFTPITEGSFFISADMSTLTPDSDADNNFSSANGTIGPAPTVGLTVDFMGSGTGRVVLRPGPSSSTATIFNDQNLDYTMGTRVSLIATPTQTSGNLSIFSGWTGCDSVLANTCTVTVNSARTISPLFELDQSTLTVTTTGSGTVTSPGFPNFIDCGSDCTGTTPTGSNFDLRATPAAGFTFTGWTGCDSVSGTQCTGTLTADRTVTATFNITTVTVPNVVGQTQAAATAAINGVTGLSVGAVTQASSATVASGRVISQNPGPSQVSSGSTVALVVSTGPAPVTVPNVVGQTQAAATARINGVTGLSVGAVTQASSPTIVSGAVISQNPGPSQVPSGSTVALVVSTGPPPVTVPNVVGQTQGAATAAINGVTGLSVGAVTQASSATVASGRVISQNPGPSQVSSGSTVALVVSTGPAPVTVPNVVGQTQAAATAAINGVNGLSVGAVSQASSPTIVSGAVISQNPGPSQVSSGSTVALVVSTGPAPVTVPNVVGQTQAAATAAINGVNGLNVGAVTQANSASVASGAVISQNPAPSQVPNGSTVAFVVSLGPVQRTLTVTPPVNGTITGTGINCGTDCSETVNNGTPIILTATPNPGFEFTRWETVSGTPPSACPGTGTCTVILNTNRTVTTIFTALINQAPVVEAGPNQVINLPAGATLPVNVLLAGTVTDDGLPIATTLTTQWRLANGPAVIPDIDNNVMPAVSFPAIGSYTMELSATDGASLTTSDTVIITINDPSAAQVLVPSVVGQPQAAANSALIAVTLTLGTISQELNATVAAGSVIRQTPTGGDFVDQGSPVNLVISSGTELLLTTPTDGPDATPGDGVCETSTGSGACSLRAAIQEANAFPGQQTITLAPETYTLTLAGANEDAAATGDLDIRDDLTIESATGNADDVIITGNALDRVFDIPPGSSPSVTLRGLTIQDGLIANSTGGGLRNAQGTLVVEDSVITTNQSNGSGGGLSHLGGTLTLRNTQITNNSSQGLGGGLQAQAGTVTIDGNTRFTGNTANFGGGLSTGGADVSLTNVQVENNTAVGDGGGIYKFLSPGDLLGSIQAPRVALSNTTVSNNTLVGGAADDCVGYLVNVGGNTFGTTAGCTLLAP